MANRKRVSRHLLVVSIPVLMAFSLPIMTAGAGAYNSSRAGLREAGPTVYRDTADTPTGQPLETATVETPVPPPTETGTPTPTETPSPTDLPATPTPTATTPLTPAFFRPLVVLTSYHPQPGTITPGANFSLKFSLANQGQLTANNIIVSFISGELIPRGTGGVVTVGRLEPGQGQNLSQEFAASATLAGQGAVNLEAHITYTDDSGNAFSESFALGINSSLPQATKAPSYGPAVPTATPTAAARAQLVIRDTQTDVAILQPGTPFTLDVTVVNVGNTMAHRVTMISGGATIVPGDSNSGDSPGSGGVSGSGGEFTNFSPLGASNVQSLGDISAGSSLVAHQPLIVNVSTNPGAYSFKVSFAYYDDKETLVIDDQVITLLVYLQPVVEVNFYRDPGPLFAGQPNGLPLQIVNLGRKSVVFGNMKVTSTAGDLTNNTILIGNLDAGGYFTLDALLFPETSGPMDLEITVDYTDDFNQPQTIARTIPVEILEAPPVEEPPLDGGMGPEPGYPFPTESETFWQKAVRFLRGMVGLDSGQSASSGQEGMPGEFPGEQFPLDGPPLGLQ